MDGKPMHQSKPPPLNASSGKPGMGIPSQQPPMMASEHSPPTTTHQSPPTLPQLLAQLKSGDPQSQQQVLSILKSQPHLMATFIKQRQAQQQLHQQRLQQQQQQQQHQQIVHQPQVVQGIQANQMSQANSQWYSNQQQQQQHQPRMMTPQQRQSLQAQGPRPMMHPQLSLDRTSPSTTVEEVEELATTQIEVKYTPPLPTSDDSTVLPMIFELKSKVESILQEVQQMQAQMLQTQEMLSKLMAQMVADKKN